MREGRKERGKGKEVGGGFFVLPKNVVMIDREILFAREGKGCWNEKEARNNVGPKFVLSLDMCSSHLYFQLAAFFLRA